MLTTISTPNAPKAIGPYSQAIVHHQDMVFTSGQIGIDPATGKLDGDTILSQTKRVLSNLDAILKAAGSSPDKVIRTTCYLKNMADFQAFNEVYAAYFIGKPARSTVGVQELPMGALVEIEAVASTAGL